jgi:hypothetical protein
MVALAAGTRDEYRTGKFRFAAARRRGHRLIKIDVFAGKDAHQDHRSRKYFA